MSLLTAGLVASPASPGVSSGIGGDLIVLIGIAVLLGVAAWVTVHRVGHRRRALAKFAAFHGFTYRAHTEPAPTGGALFDSARQRRWERSIEGTWSGTPFTYADVQCTTGEGRDEQVVHYSVVHMPLDWAAPHVHLPSPEVSDALAAPVPCKVEAVICGRSVVMYGRPQCRPELLEQLLCEALTIRNQAPELVRQHDRASAAVAG
jgi:hypothetical protein